MAPFDPAYDRNDLLDLALLHELAKLDRPCPFRDPDDSRLVRLGYLEVVSHEYLSLVQLTDAGWEVIAQHPEPRQWAKPLGTTASGVELAQVMIEYVQPRTDTHGR